MTTDDYDVLELITARLACGATVHDQHIRELAERCQAAEADLRHLRDAHDAVLATLNNTEQNRAAAYEECARLHNRVCSTCRHYRAPEIRPDGTAWPQFCAYHDEPCDTFYFTCGRWVDREVIDDAR